MRLVQTLVVRDEADIVDAQIAYHLNAGVDFVLATDHESVDGTTETLEAYVRDGYLRRIPEQGWNREDEWRTRMARLAATEHGADWVINTDADEFWMPRGGTLKEVFAAVPAGVGIVWVLSRQFVPRPDDGEWFAERMTVRLSAPAAVNDPLSPYRPHAKVAHRADPDIVVRHGAHGAESKRLTPLPAWYPADVLHFPFRSFEQYERKCVRRAQGDKPLGQYVRAFQAREQGRIEEAWEALLVDDATLRKGREEASLVVDTRLRDALRELRGLAGELRAPARGGAARFPAVGSTEADRDVIPEGAALRQAEIVRLNRNLDVLSVRLAAVERRGWARVGLMRLALTLVVEPGDTAELLEANLAFHLNAGVDVALVAFHGDGTATPELPAGFADRADVRLVGGDDAEWVARLAATEHAADWVIDSACREFWWPRGESLRDVVAAIPPRYGIVQALVRDFLSETRDAGPIAERATLRRVLSPDSRPESPSSALRPVYRAHPDATIDEADRVPLRAWYPIEVFRLPRAEDEAIDEETLERGLADGSLVRDARLRDALGALREAGEGERYALPAGGGPHLGLRAPSVVDDAAYAVECAAVGEVDLASLDRHIRELEGRIAFLEQRLWPRVLRTASRVARRGRSRG